MSLQAALARRRAGTRRLRKPSPRVWQSRWPRSDGRRLVLTLREAGTRARRTMPAGASFRWASLLAPPACIPASAVDGGPERAAGFAVARVLRLTSARSRSSSAAWGLPPAPHAGARRVASLGRDRVSDAAGSSSTKRDRDRRGLTPHRSLLAASNRWAQRARQPQPFRLSGWHGAREGAALSARARRALSVRALVTCTVSVRPAMRPYHRARSRRRCLRRAAALALRTPADAESVGLFSAHGPATPYMTARGKRLVRSRPHAER